MIIGALSAISIPLFIRYQLKSKSTEGKTNLGAIRVLEEAHFSEFKVYLTAAPEPPAVPGASPSTFDPVNSDVGRGIGGRERHGTAMLLWASFPWLWMFPAGREASCSAGAGSGRTGFESRDLADRRSRASR
jgi:hypothetical protein